MALESGWRFVRAKKWLILALSALMIVPCLWHRRIEAGDLGSHVYNAWLAELVEKGQAPGLYIARQWNNVLFEWMLLHVGKIAGFAAAEKIVVATCALIFFWGVFALMGAASERAPWFLTPCIAMLTYGYSFSMGFLNYYLSLGLACSSLALLWRGRGWGRAGGAALAPLALLAHPLGFLWIAGTVIYVAIWSKLGTWWKLSLPAAVASGFLALRWYLAHRAHFPVDWLEEPFYLFNGADQLALYGNRYVWLAGSTLLFGVVCFSVDAFAQRRDSSWWKCLRLPLELYVVAFCATTLLPENLQLSLFAGWIGLLVTRLTTISAILGLCVMSVLRPRKWQLGGFGVCAAVFFLFLYQNTLVLNHMESSAEYLVDGFPPGTRVISTIWGPPDSRIAFIGHIVDRACIGHCFSYANYEPSSGQFRMRVHAGSPVVTAFADDAEDMQGGNYEVQDEDLPVMQIYQCDDKDLTKLCIRELVSGEKNGRIGYIPPSN